jgi:hypothetical protein
MVVTGKRRRNQNGRCRRRARWRICTESGAASRHHRRPNFTTGAAIIPRTSPHGPRQTHGDILLGRKEGPINLVATTTQQTQPRAQSRHHRATDFACAGRLPGCSKIALAADEQLFAVTSFRVDRQVTRTHEERPARRPDTGQAIQCRLAGASCTGAAPRAGGEGVLSWRACSTMTAVLSRNTASMFGWFRATPILTNPSGVPIVSFSSCRPTEPARSIPNICPPALRTTRPYLLSASATLVMSGTSRSGSKHNGPPCRHGRPPDFLTVIAVSGCTMMPDYICQFAYSNIPRARGRSLVGRALRDMSDNA